MKKYIFLTICFTQISCSSLFYHPSSQIFSDPKEYKFNKDEFVLHTSDREQIQGWVISTCQKNCKGTILQFHGNAENMTSHYRSLIWFVENGYRLITFDYRGYGQSSGKPSQKGTYLDARAILEYALEFHNKNRINIKSKFIVFAQSLGGIIAARALEEFHASNEVDLLILDSTFMSYKDVAQQKLASNFITWLFSPLGQILVSDEYASIKSIKKNQIKTLVIHDALDPVIDFENGLDIYKNLNSNKEFWVFDDALHAGAFSVLHTERRKKLLNYIDNLN